MKTKKIREVIAEYQRLTGPPRGERKADLIGALEEMETLERAAKAMVAWNRRGQPALDSSAARAWSVIEDLAQTEPPQAHACEEECCLPK